MSLPLNIFTPAQAAILLGIAAVLGACMGSFINCLAGRMVEGESVLRGRSHCDTCGHVLGPLDLIPVISWLALRGRCRHCGARVSVRHVVVELVLAVAFPLLVVVHGIGVPTLAYLAFTCVLMGAALVDLDTFTIPNGFVIAGTVLWLVSVWFMGVPAGDAFGPGSALVPLVGRGWLALALDGLMGAVLVGGGILVFSLLFDAVTKKRSLGGGDVKLLVVSGLYLGFAGSLLAVLVACVLGLVFAAIQTARAPSDAKRLAKENGQSQGFASTAIPFGPSIAVAVAFTLVAGPSILGWYMGLL